ncbi:MAG: NFACT family protein [Nitrospinota bacterium]|nr:NFACT family protein [Nitrospinota bacterium]
MNITAGEIAQVLKEAAGALDGSFIHKVYQTGAQEWTLETRQGDERLWLLISLSPRNGRIHLLQKAPEDTLPLEGFARTLKKTITRRKVLSIRQMGGDRVAHITLGGAGGEMTLAVELMGTVGNMYLFDQEGRVGAKALPRKSRNEPGAIYVLPETHKSKAQDHAALALKPVDGARFPFNLAMERRSEGPAMEEKLGDARAMILSPLRVDLKKMEKLRKKLEGEMAALRGYEGYRKLGDLLKTNYHSIMKGAALVEVDDLFSPGMEKITIALDPAKGPEKNAEAYYKKHRKFEKGAPRIEQELSSLKSKEEPIRKRMEAVKGAETLADLAPFLAREDDATSPGKSVGAKGYGAKGSGARGSGAKGGKKEKESAQYSGPRRFISSEGHTILVGRNDQENDEITFRIANGRDLWLHARDYPGSHVVARLPKGVEPSARTIQEAAMIALKYSKAAKGGKGEVTWCLAKQIKKPKGAPAGKVLVHGAKSVSARIDEEAIQAMKVK